MYSDLFALDFNTECSYLNTLMIESNKKIVKANVKYICEVFKCNI